MQEVDRFPVEGSSLVAQNGHLASKIGDKPYKIEAIKRDPPTGESGDQEWVITGEDREANMQEVDRFPVEGSSPVAQNGHLASKIGDKPYKIEAIKRDPATEESGDQEWVITGEW